MKDENEGRSQDDGHCPKCGDDEGCCCALDGMLVVHPDKIEKLEQENKELRTRVADLEQCLSGRARFQENEALKNRLSTLLKASEGMEKALESYHSSFEIMRDDGENYWIRMQNNYPHATKALADFRAVKEVAGNG